LCIAPLIFHTYLIAAPPDSFEQATDNGGLYGGRAKNQVKIAKILGLWGEFLMGVKYPPQQPNQLRTLDIGPAA
jgi:hypothetical protein